MKAEDHLILFIRSHYEATISFEGICGKADLFSRNTAYIIVLWTVKYTKNITVLSSKEKSLLTYKGYLVGFALTKETGALGFGELTKLFWFIHKESAQVKIL